MREVLRAGGVDPRYVAHIGFNTRGRLELAVNKRACEKVISHLTSFDGVNYIESISASTADSKIDEHVAGLKTRTRWRANRNIPGRRFGKLIANLPTVGARAAFSALFYGKARAGPSGPASA
jgi:hypothetical protein